MSTTDNPIAQLHEYLVREKILTEDLSQGFLERALEICGTLPPPGRVSPPELALLLHSSLDLKNQPDATEEQVTVGYLTHRALQYMGYLPQDKAQ